MDNIVLTTMRTNLADEITTIRTNGGTRAAERLAKFELGVDEVHISCIYEVVSQSCEAPSTRPAYDYVFKARCEKKPVSEGLVQPRQIAYKSRRGGRP